MKTPMNEHQQFDGDPVTGDDWPFPTSGTQAPPDMGWQEFIVIGLVLLVCVASLVAAMV